MEQKQFYKHLETSLQYFANILLASKKYHDNNKACHYVFFDKDYRPYIIEMPLEFINRDREPEPGLHRFFVYTTPISLNPIQNAGLVAYISLEIREPIAYLAMLRIENKAFLRHGIARNLVNFFEYFSFIHGKREAEGMAVPLNKNIDLEELKNFYEKLGYTTNENYLGTEKFYELHKKLDGQKMLSYHERLATISIDNVHFKVCVPKEFAKEPIENLIIAKKTYKQIFAKEQTQQQ